MFLCIYLSVKNSCSFI